MPQAMKDIYKTTETENYIVIYNVERKLWELRRKYGKRSIYLKCCIYQTPLIIAAREMESPLFSVLGATVYQG